MNIFRIKHGYILYKIMYVIYVYIYTYLYMFMHKKFFTEIVFILFYMNYIIMVPSVEHKLVVILYHYNFPFNMNVFNTAYIILYISCIIE